MAQLTSGIAHSSPPSATPSTDDTQPGSDPAHAIHHELAFPVIPVSKSLASLASSEASITMTRNKAAQQTTSNLEDSTFEVLGESAILSDVETDDGNTASLTSQSVDGRTPDDLESLADTEDEEQYETVSRRDVTDTGDHEEEHGDGEGDDLAASNISTSEDEAEDGYGRSRGISSQVDRHIEESELTARPDSPKIDIDMSPSLQHLRRQPMTDSELFDHHNLPPPRALTKQDVKDWVLKLPHELYQDACMLTEELFTAARHVSKTARLTYQANRQSADYYGKIVGRTVLALLGVFVMAWLSSHLTITLNTNNQLPAAVVSQVTSAVPSPLVRIGSSVKDMVSDALATSISSPQGKPAKADLLTTGISSDVGLPMQTITIPESTEFVAHILGDNHFILTPSKHFLSQKKQPELFVNVARKGEVIPASVSKYDGVYAVEIERDQAWGPLDILLYSKTKPKIKQQFTLNFGSPWLKLGIWQASAEKVSRSAREEWSAVNGLVATALQQARKDLKVLRTQLNNDANDRAAEFSDRATAIQKDLSRVMTAQSKALGSHLATLQQSVARDVSTRASKVTKELSKLYSSVGSIDPYGPLRELQNFHAQVAARAQTNAANIVKKLQQRRVQRKEARQSKASDKAPKKAEKKSKKRQEKVRKSGEAVDSRSSRKKQAKAARNGGM